MEAWHGVLFRTIGAFHPTFFKFLLALHSEKRYQDLRIAKVVSGHAPEVVPRKYRARNNRLLAVVKKYETMKNSPIIEYLEMLAHNIDL